MKHIQPRKFKVGDRVTIRAGVPIDGFNAVPDRDIPAEVIRVDDPTWSSVIPYQVTIPETGVPWWSDVGVLWVGERNIKLETEN